MRSVPLPPHPGNIYRPFAELMQLETIDRETFRSVHPPYAPGGPVGPGRSYGAHVYAQAAWAASQTVEKGFILHVSGQAVQLDMTLMFISIHPGTLYFPGRSQSHSCIKSRPSVMANRIAHGQ